MKMEHLPDFVPWSEILFSQRCCLEDECIPALIFVLVACDLAFKT
jgi:hypothetical protein